MERNCCIAILPEVLATCRHCGLRIQKNAHLIEASECETWTVCQQCCPQCRKTPAKVREPEFALSA